jgi:hypothetical protein
VEDSEDEDIDIGYFVPDFIIPHENSTHFAGLEFSQPSSQVRVGGNAFCSCDQLTNDANRGGAVNGMQKLVKAKQI